MNMDEYTYILDFPVVESKIKSRNRKRPNKKNTIYLHYRIRHIYKRIREA